MPDVAISYKGSQIASMDASGSKTLLTEGKYCEDDIVVQYTRYSPNLQSKQVSPTTSSQTVSPDSGYDGLSSVTVNAMPSGTAGTPTATKGTVSNHSVSVTPSVTNTTGYITGGTKTGTAVTVSASELVSGTKTISSSGTTDVTNYASASVASGSARTPATTITANPTISVSASGMITASVSKTQNVTPSVTAGYVASGTSGTITVSGSRTTYLAIYEGEYHNVCRVTVSLTNPVNEGYFDYIEMYSFNTGSYIDEISSASGEITFTIEAEDSIELYVYGTSPYIDSTKISCTGGIALTDYESSSPLVFSVSASGTITIDGIDYNY